MDFRRMSCTHVAFCIVVFGFTWFVIGCEDSNLPNIRKANQAFRIAELKEKSVIPQSAENVVIVEDNYKAIDTYYHSVWVEFTLNGRRYLVKERHGNGTTFSGLTYIPNEDNSIDTFWSQQKEK